MKDTYLVDNYSINCKGNLIDLSKPKIMGIINVTPDSFYDGGKIKSDKELLIKDDSFKVSSETNRPPQLMTFEEVK